jgi:formate C-acetyltransferase
MLNCGFASAVDSVMAVKEFVFDKKEVTLAELAECLKSNWNKHEILRLKIKKSPHKYGNNDALTDTYAAAMSSYFANKVNNVPNGRGGVYKAIFHSARAFIDQGEKTGALPDGRLKGEELSKNASPVVGMDKNGITALIESATNLIPSDYHESFCLDVMLHPSSVEGTAGYMVFKGLLMTYLKKGGQSIQFNIFDTNTLRDAQENPDKYKNLQVRVCGWNTLWNHMSKQEQDAYILRAENIQ